MLIAGYCEFLAFIARSFPNIFQHFILNLGLHACAGFVGDATSDAESTHLWCFTATTASRYQRLESA
jgi:hypothetical protein